MNFQVQLIHTHLRDCVCMNAVLTQRLSAVICSEIYLDRKLISDEVIGVNSNRFLSDWVERLLTQTLGEKL